MKYIRANEMIVPIRKIPSHDGEYIDEMLLGMPAEVLWEDRDNFVYIETYYGYRGYVDLSMVVEDQWQSDQVIKVSGRFVDITKEVSYDSAVVASVLKGSFVKSLEEKQAERLLVELPDGRKGWLRNNYIKPYFNKEEARKALMETAESYLNSQFRWGGKSVLGMDVSGFVSMVYLYHDMILYRDIKLNNREFEVIMEHELLPGDLLFFEEHPALYVGDDEFLHSTAVYCGVLKGSLDPNSELYKEEYSREICTFAKVKGL